ncbi:molybdopterin-dependent oxidoreductase [Sulfurimonas sp.]
MSSITACPLDCYDACGIVYDNGKLKAFKDGHTKGFLCPHMNHYETNSRILKPLYKGEEISMDEALLKLKEMLDANLKSEALHYKGHGNFALMQDVLEHTFANMGATLTDGTLCDGAGEAGIIEGRGSNKNMPLSEIEKSDVVIFWGRNPHVTSSHLLPIIKDKTIIVIDPVRTKIAKVADLHIQLQPHSDMLLAMLMVRFFHINGLCDEEYLEKYATEFEEYYELTQTVRIKATLEQIGVTLGDIGQVIDMVTNKKVAVVVGVGVQKYQDGADIMRCIDAFGVSLGLFGREGCGIAYLGNSKEAIESPFHTKAKRVSKVNTPFDEFKTVFIQGANPLSQMPDSQRVRDSIEHCENVVYFGLYENETSEVADLVIPAKTFLEKDDIRTSYSHNSMMLMNKQLESDVGISEYDLASYLAQAYDVELKSETEYIEHFKNHAVVKIDGSFEVENRENIPYKNGFDTDDGEFLFLEEYDVRQNAEDELYLITPKAPTSLNSQFNRQEYVYLNSSHGIKEAEKLEVSSVNGTVILRAKISEDLRDDTLLIYSGTRGVNNLTTSKHSLDGKCAIFQENRVKILKID